MDLLCSSKRLLRVQTKLKAGTGMADGKWVTIPKTYDMETWMYMDNLWNTPLASAPTATAAVSAIITPEKEVKSAMYAPIEPVDHTSAVAISVPAVKAKKLKPSAAAKAKPKRRKSRMIWGPKDPVEFAEMVRNMRKNGQL
jgi:hypothetical protein